MFDPKPEAPLEIRGPYKAIPSHLPGALVCEMLPLTAAVLDKTAIIRSFTHPFDDHFGVTRWCLAGRREPDNSSSYPSSGSIASRFCGPRQPGMPPYVMLSEEPALHHHLFDAMGPGYFGAAHLRSPSCRIPIGTTSNTTACEVPRAAWNWPTILRSTGSTIVRPCSRSLIACRAGSIRERAQDGLDPFAKLAVELVTSGKARRAFDLNEETAATRNRYGFHRWGQMALLARRLAESGVTFVTLNTAPDCLRWDWHANIVRENRAQPSPGGPNVGMELNGPPLDRAFAALIADLSEREQCRNVLLVVWGEFGRSPRINPSGGRDHWPRLGSVLFAGGGLKTGQIIGASSPDGGLPTERPIGPGDVLATLYKHLGIDPSLNAVNLQGRPLPLLPDGNPIDELF